MIINLISGPRNISTALMYSFAQRTDTKVIDEPFYAHYLVKTRIDHPGKEETIASMSSEVDEILGQIQELSNEYDIVFLKNMAHHHIDMEWDYLLDMQNVFLIRDPKQLIASFAQVIPHPTMQDIGLKLEAELQQFLREKGHANPIVIDSNDVLPNPENGLQQLCNKLGIAFDQNMLHWEEGPIKEDGAWAEYWYKNVHNSTGFVKQKTSERPLPDHCVELYQEALPYYNKLKELSRF
ncbi:MAG: sulfotransferase family protein [Bacteroidota bacterium]